MARRIVNCRLIGLGFILLLLSGCANVFGLIGNSFQAQRAFEAGLQRYTARDYPGAVPYLELAVALDSSLDDARAYLAWTYYRTGDYTAATRQFRLGLLNEPEWAGLHDGLGWSRYQLQRYHLALEAFRQALVLDPNYRDAQVGLAYSLFALERYGEARPILARLVQEGENSFQPSVSDVEQIRPRYAWTLFYLNDHAAALAQFQKGLQANPEWAGLHNGLGWTTLRLGDRRAALASFRRAVELRPDFDDAKEGLTLATQSTALR